MRNCRTCHVDITDSPNKRYCSKQCQKAYVTPLRPCVECRQPMTVAQSRKGQQTCGYRCDAMRRTRNSPVMDVMETHAGEWMSARTVWAFLPDVKYDSVRSALLRLEKVGLVTARPSTSISEDSWGRNRWHVESEYRAVRSYLEVSYG